MRGCLLVLAIARCSCVCLAATPEPTGCPDFTIEAPRMRSETVRAADFGFREDSAENAAAVNRALAEAKRIGAGRVELSPGTYRCRDARGIVFDGLEDVVFDGKGAKLVFCRPSDIAEGQETIDPFGANVMVRNCRRMELSNFTMDWDWETDPIAIWVRAVDRKVSDADDASYVDFDLADGVRHPRYPAPVPVLEIFEAPEDRSGGTLPRYGRSFWHGAAQGHFGAKNEWVSPTRLRVWPFVMQPCVHQCEADRKRFSAKANRAAVRNFKLGVLYAMSHYYYGKNGFNLFSSSDLTLRDIRVDSCRGFGVEVSGTQRKTQFVNVRFAPPVNSTRPFSCSADGFHVVRSQGWFKFIGCEWARCQDDFVNLHDRTTLAWPTGERVLEVVNTRGVRYFGASAGDEIELREDDYAATGWRGQIVAVEGERLVFDRSVPRPKGLCFILFNRTYATDNYLFRDCTFRDSRTSRTIAMGSNVTFENCRFERLSRSPLRIQMCYTPNVWCEGTLTRNVVVRGCTFRDCLGFGNGESAQLFIGGRIPWKGDPIMTQVPIANERFRKAWEAQWENGAVPRIDREAFSGFLVENNVFVNAPGFVIDSPNANGLACRGNRIVREGSPVCPPFEYAGRSRFAGKINTP